MPPADRLRQRAESERGVQFHIERQQTLTKATDQTTQANRASRLCRSETLSGDESSRAEAAATGNPKLADKNERAKKRET